MSKRSSSSQDTYGNSSSSRSFRHNESYQERNSQHTSAGGHNDDYMSGARGNTQRQSSVRDGSDGHHGEEPAYGSGQSYSETSNNMNRNHRRSVAFESDNGSGNDSFRNQSGSSNRYGDASRGGQGSQCGSSDEYRDGSSGSNDNSSSEYNGASREIQGEDQGDSYGPYRGGYRGSHGDRSGGYSDSAIAGQSEGHGNSSREYNGNSRHGQTEDNVGSSSGSSGSGDGCSLGQNEDQSGNYRGYPSSNTAGRFSGGFSSRSTGGFSNRGSPNHGQGFGGLSSNGGYGGISGAGGQRGGFGNDSLAAFSYGGGDSLLQAGEKETMQNLNTRLATYMDKVHALEDSNGDLEIKIRNWYETHKPEKIDYTKYYKIIDELRDKIFSATVTNNHVTVQNDNARLAADDFKVKYDNERHLYKNMDSDTSALCKVLDDLTLDKSSLESQIESLQEELAYRKKNHEDEMKCLQVVPSDVTVQMDAAPGVNILKILNDTRAQYEDMAEENRKKAEEEYKQKVNELKSELCHSSEQMECVKSESMELRRTVQNLEIELQTHLAMKNSLENTLAETEGRYCDQLAHIQDKVTSLEDQLAQLRNELASQSREYNLLLDIRSKLENEINMYRKLLEEEGCSNYGDVSSRRGGTDLSSVSDQQRRRIVTKVTEERVDDRIISRKVDKI